MSTDIKSVEHFWDSQPCNINHSNNDKSDITYFKETEDKRYFVEPHIIDFANFSNYHGKSVLELGCGIGMDSINFARNGADITCVDLSSESLNLAKQRFDVFKEKGIFYQCNIENLSNVVPIKSYDLIYSFGVIHHTPSPQRVINEIKKYCHKDTEIKIMLYSKFSWKSMWIIFKYGRGNFFKATELIQKYSEAQEGCPITYVFTKNQIKELFNDFEIKSIKKTHIFPWKIEDYKNHRYNKVWYFKILPNRIFRLLERIAGWHYLIHLKVKQ